MTANDEKDYSQYVGHIGRVSQVISIFAGFTLTALILVINLFSDRSAPLVQATFYLLTFLFYLFTFLPRRSPARDAGGSPLLVARDSASGHEKLATVHWSQAPSLSC